MADIGSQLKAARERLGLTTVQAAQRLHMRAMFVEALEREDWKTVGEPVYVRGFVRNYARLLGLDPEACVGAFNASDFAEAASTEAALDFEQPQRSRFRYPWLLAGMSALAVVLVFKVVWTMAVPGAAGHAEIHPPAASAMVSTNAQPALVPGANAAARSQQNGVDLRLELTQSCWLSVTVDGRRVVYQTLPAGTVKDFHGVREITLRAGNAGGVVATIDGQHLGTLGGLGQVEDRVFAVKTPPAGQDGVHE
jgi:cytoskeletal protein RodZ